MDSSLSLPYFQGRPASALHPLQQNLGPLREPSTDYVLQSVCDPACTLWGHLALQTYSVTINFQRIYLPIPSLDVLVSSLVAGPGHANTAPSETLQSQTVSVTESHITYL